MMACGTDWVDFAAIVGIYALAMFCIWSKR